MSQASYAMLMRDYEALKAEVAVKAEVIEKLEARIAELVDQDRLIIELRCEVAELKGRLNTDSHNSSKPPSSDGYVKPAPRSLRRASGRHPGKQPGAKGARLLPVQHPDKVVNHAPSKCKSCGWDLEDAKVTSTEVRQVFDLPPMSPEVTEHRV